MTAPGGASTQRSPSVLVDRRYIALGQLRDEGPAFVLDIGGMPTVRLIEVE